MTSVSAATTASASSMTTRRIDDVKGFMKKSGAIEEDIAADEE